jgi:pteridine reductase
LRDTFPEQIKLYPFNLGDPQALGELGSQIATEGGPISGLITVASEFFHTPLGTVTEKNWDTLFESNVKGHFFLIQGVLPYLKANSHILTLVDIHASKPLKQYSVYCSAKGSLLTLSRNLAKELAPKTRVNSISPGLVLAPDHYSMDKTQKIINTCPLGRSGTPEDIYEGVLFLFNNDYINGFNLMIDGGSSLL